MLLKTLTAHSEIRREKFDALTGLRAIAVTLVFIYHNRKYWREDVHGELIRLFNEFHIGVSIFFVLSGFLIAFNYGDKIFSNLKSYSNYILIRMARILPLYWLILTAYYLDPRFGKMDFSALTYTLTHGLSNKYNLYAIAQSWSLSVEMCFYFLAPLLFFIERKKIVYLFVAAISIFLITWAAGEIWFNVNGNPNQFFSPINFLFNSTFPGRSLEFIAGMLLASAVKKKMEILNWKYKTLIGFLGIFLTSYALGFFQNEVYRHGYEHPIGRIIFMTILPFFIVLMIAGLITEKTKIQRFLSWRFLILLGNASYAFYLIHISYVNIRMREIYLGPDRNFIFLWALSIILYLFFEKPIYNGVRKLLKKN